MVFGCQMDSALRQDNSFCPSAFQQVLHPPFFCKLVLYNLHYMQNYITIYIG